MHFKTAGKHDLEVVGSASTIYVLGSMGGTGNLLVDGAPIASGAVTSGEQYVLLHGDGAKVEIELSGTPGADFTITALSL